MDTNTKKIYSKINNNDDYIVFGLSTCMFCSETKKFLQKKKLNYKYYPVDDYKNLLLEKMTKLANIKNNININPEHKTFPIIFYKKKFIGGYTDLLQYVNSH